MDNLDKVIESILFVAGTGVDFFDIAEKLNVKTSEVEKAVKKLQDFYEKNSSGIRVVMFNKKAQLSSDAANAESVAEVLNPIKEKALTKAVLETIAIIAYKQPITRLEIEEVRGVNADYAINNLLENKLIDVVGRKDAVGKPLLFGTTEEFLKRFKLNELSDLPDYDELLERIEVIKTPNQGGLFDYSNIPTEEEIEEQIKTDIPTFVAEQQDEEVENDVVAEMLNALKNDDVEELA